MFSTSMMASSTTSRPTRMAQAGQDHGVDGAAAEVDTTSAAVSSNRRIATMLMGAAPPFHQEQCGYNDRRRRQAAARGSVGHDISMNVAGQEVIMSTTSGPPARRRSHRLDLALTRRGAVQRPAAARRSAETGPSLITSPMGRRNSVADLGNITEVQRRAASIVTGTSPSSAS